MDATHAAIDSLAAVDVQGTLASKPAAGIRGRWYATTDTLKQLFREDGSAWREVPLLESAHAYAGLITFSNGLAIADAKDVTIGTTTGTKIGQATSKIGFFGASPVVVPAANGELIGALVALGLITGGGAWTLSTGTGGGLTVGSGGITFTNSAPVNMADGGNIALGTTTGTKIGTTTSQKLGFWGTAPVVKGAVTGSRGGNAALASLLTYLASLGFLTDNSTA